MGESWLEHNFGTNIKRVLKNQFARKSIWRLARQSVPFL